MNCSTTSVKNNLVLNETFFIFRFIAIENISFNTRWVFSRWREYEFMSRQEGERDRS